jgi:hypothetical protein
MFPLDESSSRHRAPAAHFTVLVAYLPAGR